MSAQNRETWTAEACYRDDRDGHDYERGRLHVNESGHVHENAHANGRGHDRGRDGRGP